MYTRGTVFFPGIREVTLGEKLHFYFIYMMVSSIFGSFITSDNFFCFNFCCFFFSFIFYFLSPSFCVMLDVFLSLN